MAGTPRIKVAASHAIADTVAEEELQPDYIIPSVFNRKVADAVATAVIDAAYATGVARRERGAPFDDGDGAAPEA